MLGVWRWPRLGDRVLLVSARCDLTDDRRDIGISKVVASRGLVVSGGPVASKQCPGSEHNDRRIAMAETTLHMATSDGDDGH